MHNKAMQALAEEWKHFRPEQMAIKPYIVSGLGMSFICYDRSSVLEWCQDIINKGGWPEVRPYLPLS